MKNKKLIITISVIAISIVLAIVGYFKLPETLVVQITLGGGAGNTLPKALGLLLPLLLSCAFAIVYYKTETAKEARKNLIISVASLMIYILIFAFNR